VGGFCTDAGIFTRSTIPPGTFLELLCFGGNQFQSVGMGVTGQERGLLEAEGGTSLDFVIRQG
jgi:hypothetical protein